MCKVHSLYKNPGLMLKTSEIMSGGVIGKGYPCRDYIFKLCKISLQKSTENEEVKPISSILQVSNFICSH